MTDEHVHVTVTQKAALFGPGGDVLLLRRRSNDAWDVPGGRIGTDEDVISGLRREVREETSLDVTVEEPIYTDTWMTEDGDGRYSVVYRCETDEQAVELSEEHREWEWIDPETAVEDILPASELREALDRAAKRRRVTP